MRAAYRAALVTLGAALGVVLGAIQLEWCAVLVGTYQGVAWLQ